MRVISLAAVSALALGAAACGPNVNYAARTALDCPDRQGELERTSISADRKTCTYRAGEGAEVTLQLTPVSGDATQTLSGIEASLLGPAPAVPAASEGGEPPPPPPPPASPAPPKPPGPPSGDAARAAQEAAQDAKGSGASEEDWSTGRERSAAADVEGHGLVGGDDHANINLPGLHIEAGDNKAKVDVGGVRIDASGDEATVHMIREVRLAGEAFSREKRGVRATFIAKRENLPGGYRLVGYQAAGPKTGPLTVAVVRSRDAMDDSHRVYRDIERLVRRNGGA